ncbi:MAG TPA: serine hydrolase domain-containing protein [Archangium sp.]|uniref:serine hydrolase domain-containing protein n=1 Tax=Archangium sp. TaxID=1872627 RepID=UPI002E2F3FEE|nr:serine hydrolase domain-containing protein [Archangium sp.]HEX5748506.1 serine hydrolase domain-containing protein [Archangium sp.]
MRSSSLALLLLPALLLSAGCATSHAARATDAYIQAVLEKNHVPGAAVAVVRDGHLENLSTYGLADLEAEAKSGPDTAFQIASATKIFTGTLVMLLAQEGKLGLDEPLSTYLPDAPETWKGLTVRHLAAHTSGVASGLKKGSEEQTRTDASVAERYESARKAPLEYTPGERSAYGLTDFVVLTHVLEKVTGQGFEELLRGRVFEPLGFTCTRFEHARQQGPVRIADVIPRRATTYRYEDGAQQRAWFLYPPHTYSAGGAFSCVRDLVRWAVAMDQGTLLTPESQQAAATPFKLNDGREGDFGVAFTHGTLRGLKTFGHSGGGALGDVLRVPEKKLTVIVLTNEQALLPLLAPNIASLYLPPLPELNAPGIPDAEPALTEVLRGAVDGLLQGTLDAAAFAPSAQQELLPVLQGFGTPGNALMPPLRRLTLLEDQKDGDSRKRVYRAVYGEDVTMKWTFRLDSAGKIADIAYDWE